MVKRGKVAQELESEKALKLLKCFLTDNILRGLENTGSQAGSLVWAKNFGSIYWPALIVELTDNSAEEEVVENDVDANSIVMVIFLECKFRRAAVPWGRVMPVRESSFDEQKDLVIKLNKAETKKPGCCNSPAFKKSLEYLNEFRSHVPEERYMVAQTKYLKMEADRPKSRKRKSEAIDSSGSNTTTLVNADDELYMDPNNLANSNSRSHQLSRSQPPSGSGALTGTGTGPSKRVSLYVGVGRPKRPVLNPNSENSDSFTSGRGGGGGERKSGGRYSLRPPASTEVEVLVVLGNNESGSGRVGKENKLKLSKLEMKRRESEMLDKEAEEALVLTVLEEKRKGIRPKTGGSELKEWAAEKFGNVDKSFRFEPRIPLLCSSIKCLDPIEGTPEYCHEFPFHSTCLTEIRELSSEDGKKCYKCEDCISKNCFLCKKSDEKCVKCSKCDLRYHVHCLRAFPQAEIQSEMGPITCPLHFCHTCIAEHQIMKKVRNYKACKSTSLRCIQCPTSYHRACLPASSVTSVMTSGFVTCPRHENNPPGTKRLGCFMCNQRLQSKRNSGYVDCTKCPLSYHLKCILDEGTFQHFEEDADALTEYRSTFECEACFWGLYPLPGQAVWCQQANFSFWPARILYPKENSVEPELSGLFSVVYFGAQQTNFHQACYKRVVPLNIGAYDVLRKIKMYNNTDPRIMTSYEEGTYVMDLSESHRSSILPAPEPIYKKIEKNVYKTVKPNGTKSQKRVGRDRDEDGTEPGNCLCDQDKTAAKICGFANGCINRDQAIECDDKTCGDSSRCTNRMFTSKNSNERIEAFPTSTKGWGVRTKTPLKKGDFVVEYVGEVISKEAYQWRLGRKVGNDAHYFLELDTNLCIDAEYMGNLSRLINHSCDPNCSTEKYMSGGKQVVGIFVRYDVPAGTELTFDYDYETCGRSFSCSCGSSVCRGQINRNHIRNNQVGGSVDRGDSPSQGRKDEEWNEECEICKYEGAFLLCCEAPGCEKAYHASCLGMSAVPPGTWICPDPLHQQSLVTAKKVKKPKKVKKIKVLKVSKEPAAKTGNGTGTGTGTGGAGTAGGAGGVPAVSGTKGGGGGSSSSSVVVIEMTSSSSASASVPDTKKAKSSGGEVKNLKMKELAKNSNSERVTRKRKMSSLPRAALPLNKPSKVKAAVKKEKSAEPVPVLSPKLRVTSSMKTRKSSTTNL